MKGILRGPALALGILLLIPDTRTAVLSTAGIVIAFTAGVVLAALALFGARTTPRR